MSEEAFPVTPEPIDFVMMTSAVVSAYVAHNATPPSELPALLRSVHDTLMSLGAPAAPAVVAEPLKPAVNPKHSVFDGHIVSLIDGKPYKMLRRHLSTHGHTPDSYRAAYGLAANYPMVAADYAAKRSELAKSFGLGRKAPANAMAA